MRSVEPCRRQTDPGRRVACRPGGHRRLGLRRLHANVRPRDVAGRPGV